MNRKLHGYEITLSILTAWVCGAVTFYIHPALTAVGAGILVIIFLLGILD